MRIQTIILTSALGLSLAACAKKEVAIAPPPPPPGAVAGSMAADRDGDGMIDGYYSSDGIYHANYVPPPPVQEPVYSPAVARKGERG